jgi:type II secretory pathway pseudopilin PulG
MATVAALAISAGVAAYGAYSSSQASKKAAAAQQTASDKALALQQQQYADSQKALLPYQQAGADNLKKLQGMATPTLDLPTYNYDPFKAPTQAEAAAEPGIRMMQDETARAVQNSAAARGSLLSGNTMTELQNRSAGIASQAYGDVYNRAQNAYATNAQTAWNAYQSRYNKATGEFGAAQLPWQRATEMAGIGYGATGAGINAGQNYANSAGNMLLGAGNAQAAGIVGANNAQMQGLYSGSQDMLSAYLYGKGYGTSQYGQKKKPTAGYPANEYDG